LGRKRKFELGHIKRINWFGRWHGINIIELVEQFEKRVCTSLVRTCGS